METKLDFGSPEATIQNIDKELGGLIDELYTEGCQLVDDEVDCEKQLGNTEVKIRERLGKVNEGCVKAAMSADSDGTIVLKKAGKQKVKVDCLKKRIEAGHDTRKMFSAWMESQKVAGLPL